MQDNSATMKLQNRVLFMLFVCVSVFAIDHITKSIAINTLRDAPPMSVLGGILRIAYSENGGGILSLGTNWPSAIRFWVLTVLPGIMLILIPVVVIRTPLKLLEVTWLSLFLAGGVSNWVDRVMNQGMVVDFLNLGSGACVPVSSMPPMSPSPRRFSCSSCWHSGSRGANRHRTPRRRKTSTPAAERKRW